VLVGATASSIGSQYGELTEGVDRPLLLIGGSRCGSSEGGDGFGECQTGDGDFAVAAVEGAEADGGGFGVVGLLCRHPAVRRGQRVMSTSSLKVLEVDGRSLYRILQFRPRARA
jgi:hypothetical protein